MRPVITGIGLISSLGATAEQTFESLLAGRFIVEPCYAQFSEVAGQGDRIAQLSMQAARQAIGQAGWTDLGPETAIIVGTSKGNMIQLADVRPLPDKDAPGLNYHGFGLSEIACHLAWQLQADYSIHLTISAACASGLHALSRALLMLRSGQVRRVLVVAVESSLHPLYQGCFKRLGVLARRRKPCRPFDNDRDGFHISEAAAAVCLQSDIERSPRQGPQGEALMRRYPAIYFFTVAGDAYHLTGADPDAVALRRVISAAAAHGPFDLIHAHGTGTLLNDACELAAIESTVGAGADGSIPLPIVYSHKAALGHSLGASGLVSVVLNCLCHARNLVPPNPCTLDPLARKLPIPSEPTARCIHRSLALATGFGGSIGAIGLSMA